MQSTDLLGPARVERDTCGERSAPKTSHRLVATRGWGCPSDVVSRHESVNVQLLRKVKRLTGKFEGRPHTEGGEMGTILTEPPQLRRIGASPATP